MHILHEDDGKYVGAKERYNVFGGYSQLWLRMYKYDDYTKHWKGYGNISKLTKDDLRELKI